MKPCLSLLALASLATLGCSGTEVLPTTGTLRTEPFHSQILDDDYLLRLRLPPGYESGSDRYPLVVQLDPTFVGLREFEITSGFVSDHAARGEWREAIVLGVDYVEPFNHRERDYRPPSPPRAGFDGEGADLFYRVLRDEILPAVEAELRVDPARRTVVGHSNGALFACYAALRARPGEPLLFSTVVSADGGYDAAVLQYQAWHAQATRELPITWYLSRAVYNGAVQKIGFDALIERVAQAGYEGLRFVSEELETDHGGAIRPSFERGLALALGGAR